MQYLPACGLLLAASAYAGDVDLRTTDAGRVSLRVTSAPLSEVLDRMARQTGMKVIYDGPPPRTLVVGRQVENATLTDAVVDLLEGLGVGYALRLDATGARVQTLLVLGAVKGGSPAAGATTSAAASTSPPLRAPRALVPTVRLPGFGNVPAPLPEDADEDVPSERNEEATVEQRPGEARRPPVPTTMPTMPTFPLGPISPLMLPAPPPSTQPTPPPQ